MRLEITQRADLAIRALVALQHSPDRMKSAELAGALGTTAGFIPQVMRPLVRAEWVRSVPGPRGGYEPHRDLGSLTVLQVVEEIDGPTDNGRCVVTERRCDTAQPCALHAAWAGARRELRRALDAMPLSSLAAG